MIRSASKSVVKLFVVLLFAMIPATSFAMSVDYSANGNFMIGGTSYDVTGEVVISDTLTPRFNNNGNLFEYHFAIERFSLDVGNFLHFEGNGILNYFLNFQFMGDWIYEAQYFLDNPQDFWSASAGPAFEFLDSGGQSYSAINDRFGILAPTIKLFQPLSVTNLPAQPFGMITLTRQSPARQSPEVVPVPEPSTLLLLSTGLIGLLTIRKRSKFK